MEFFKKNWMQVLTLVLCALLMVGILKQEKQLQQLEEQLDNMTLGTDLLYDKVEDFYGNIMDALEESGTLVSAYALEPTGLDAGTHSLLVDLSVTLKEWRTDTQATLLVTAGEETREFPMTTGGSGCFTAPMAVPLDTLDGFWLDLTVNNGGTVTREKLGGWGDVSMLLPLQMGGCGWQTPSYSHGEVQADHWPSVTLEDQRHESIRVSDPKFQIYRNGELIETRSGALDREGFTYDGQISYTAEDSFSVPCREGDIVTVTFFCKDAYGLGYEFRLHGWTVGKENVRDLIREEEPFYGEDPVLTWE